MFELITGLPPFHSENVQLMYFKIIRAEVDYPEYIRADAIHLLNQLLVTDQLQRLCDINVIKEHPFFDQIDWDKLVAREIKPPFTPNEIIVNNPYAQDDFEGFTYTPPDKDQQ
mmetsp:Transcript_16515/g.25681  ORF Transcript_16515/g.25681 Transcript_16515/m.25681 type:complete len:113 (+) Transcript_16515:587-925(+)